MALALAVGGGIAIFGTGAFGGGGGIHSNSSFVLPDEDDDFDNSGVTPEPTAELRQYTSPPALSIDPEKTYLATIETELGDIQIELLPGQALQAVNNFVFLAREGFYDGLIFHYALEDFTVIAGDPSCTAGSSACRGTGGPGYTIPDEINDTPFEAGVLAMAIDRNTPDSGGSQFFIALSDRPELDGSSTAFGRVLSGLDVAAQLTVGTEIQTIQIQEQ
ncbi:MAG: peptidylprolyl isomerase [Chloroflexi bacterium]|nr:peptidylprolyl isomerase [Chloroflexota bacterium]